MRIRDGVVVPVLILSLQACTKRAFLAGAAGAAAVPVGFVLLFAGASGGDEGPPSTGKSIAAGTGAVLFVGGLITVPVSMIIGLAGYAKEHPALGPSPVDARATPQQVPAAPMEGPIAPATPAASNPTPGTQTQTLDTQTPATNTQPPATNTQPPATNTQPPATTTPATPPTTPTTN
jgi:hypothetical protein